MDRATSQIGPTKSGRCCWATKINDKKNTMCSPGFNSELCGMDEVSSKSSFIIGPHIPHVAHEV